MNPGDLLLFKGEKGISRLITWVTKSPYSHIAICVSSDMSLGIESYAGKGVRAIDIRKIKEDYDIYRVKSIYQYNLSKVISSLVANLNKPYDWSGVIWLGILKVFRAKGRANDFQKKKDYFCSALVDFAFMQGGLDLVPKVSGGDITSPKDIAESNIVGFIEEVTF